MGLNRVDLRLAQPCQLYPQIAEGCANAPNRREVPETDILFIGLVFSISAPCHVHAPRQTLSVAERHGRPEDKKGWAVLQPLSHSTARNDNLSLAPPPANH